MESAPHWFGWGSSPPLLGWWTVPAGGGARGVVVLCPPLAGEWLSAYPAYRLLAENLARIGIATLRFDYAGTGDSAGGLDFAVQPDAWTAAVRAATDVAAGAGAQWIGLLGLRMGATIAAIEAHHGSPVDGLILWDPCPSGRHFLREQQALYRLSHGEDAAPSADRGVEMPGFVIPEAVAASLKHLRLPSGGHEAATTLVLTRTDRPADPALRNAIAATDWWEIDDQNAFLNASTVDAELPVRTVDRIVGWLDLHVPHQTSPLALTTVASAHVETEVVEDVVRLGPNRLVGVWTAPDSGDVSGTVLLLNVATEHHIGPGRLWVDLSRAWARVGICAYRVDLSGVGESPVRPHQQHAIAYAPEFFDDMMDVAHAINPADPTDLVPVGLCSGAYHALELAARLGTPTACAVNPILGFTPPEMAGGGEMDPRRLVCQAPKPWVDALGDARAVAWLKRRMPPVAWRMLAATRVHRAPTGGLVRATERGSRILLVCGREDALPFLGRDPRSMRKLTSSGRLHFEFVEGLDHSLTVRAPRDQVHDILYRHVCQTASRGARVPAPVG